MAASNDTGLPEPEVFLELAADAMAGHHEAHGAYPGSWHELSLTFAGRPYRTGEPGTFPVAADGSTWQPVDCRYRYVIEKADESTFRVIAYSPDGRAEYEITESQDEPRWLLPPEERRPLPRPQK